MSYPQTLVSYGFDSYSGTLLLPLVLPVPCSRASAPISIAAIDSAQHPGEVSVIVVGYNPLEVLVCRVTKVLGSK